MVGGKIKGANVDLDVILVEEVVGQLLHLLRPGSTPHENLKIAFSTKLVIFSRTGSINRSFNVSSNGRIILFIMSFGRDCLTEINTVILLPIVLSGFVSLIGSA